ncbi:unnamed protein product, partial [Adineta steineri]
VVCPSFINTGMFEGVKTDVLFPLIKSDDICDKIVEAIRKDQHMLLVPKSLGPALVMKSIISTAAQLEIQSLSGVDHSMDTFVGRR